MRLETRIQDALREGVADVASSDEAWRSIQDLLQQNGRASRWRGRGVSAAAIAAVFLAALIAIPLWLLLPLGEDSPRRGRSGTDPGETVVEAEGVSIALPAGWHGRADSLRGYTRRIIQVATFPLSPLTDVGAVEAREQIGSGDVLIVLAEYIHASDDLAESSGLPVVLGLKDFENVTHVPKWLPSLADVPEEHGLARRFFRVSPTSDPDHVPARYFDLRVEFGSLPVSQATLDRVNGVLGSLSVGEWVPESDGICRWHEIGMLDPDCPQGNWLREVLAVADFKITDDGGTFVARSEGSEFFIWAEELNEVPEAHRSLLEDRGVFPNRESVGSVTVFGNAQSWEWSPDRMHVYIGQGPSGDSTLPTLEQLVPLVHASLDVNYPPTVEEGQDVTVAEPAESSEQTSSLGFAAAGGWYTSASSIGARPDELSVAWAANVPFVSASDTSGFPTATVRALPPDGIVITAVEPRAYSGSEKFSQLQQPLALSQGTCTSTNYEGQPSDNVSRCLIDVMMKGELLNVAVWFGVNNPSEDKIDAANQELERLEIPTP
ncbi:MAG: hypothetical protein WEA10_02075 [Actinomycetota bacterium]